MPYFGSQPTSVPLTSSDITDGIISNAKLAQDIISADTALGATPADTDEFLVSDAGVLKRMDYSYIKGGITGADEWRITSSFSGDAAPIASNWERSDVHSSYIGTGMTESSGVFTFPETGIWLIQAIGAFGNNTTHSHYCGLYIRTTINDGGAWSGIASSTQGIYRGDSNNYYANAFCSALFDVTSTANCKASLQVDHQDNDTVNYGNTNQSLTGMSFIRLGST